jgi:hypothetical protein
MEEVVTMFPANHADQEQLINGLKKTSLAVSLALGLGGFSTQPMAAVSTSTLSFTLGKAQVVACNYGTTPPCNKAGYNITDIVGSYFAMDTNSNGVQPSEKTPIGSFNGIVLGTTQAASGSHSGPINGSENPNIDNPWTFFGGTGMHQSTSPITVSGGSGDSYTLDMAGWNVTWNGIASIPLTQQGAATLNCSSGSSCTDGSTYTLDAAFHVNGAKFTSVAYTLHLEGTVSVPGSPPIANPDFAQTIVGNSRTVDVLDNDTSATGFTPGSVAIVAAPANGTAMGNANNTATYTPNTTGTPFQGTDTFDYTVDNESGPSNAATVSVDVQANVAPVAGNDSVSTNPSALDNAGGKLVIAVLNNDTDDNNDPGLPGGIDVTNVMVLSQPTVGSCVANTDGTITYSQATPSTAGQFSCTYQVSDIDSFNTPLQSNVATLSINVTEITSDWPPALSPDILPVLFFNAGVPGDPTNSSIPAKSGSFFTMQVTPSTLIYTTLTPGPSAGVMIGHNQPATGSHTGAATGDEQTGIDAPWNFFSNTGFHLTRSNGITGNADGTLEFSSKWFVSWNGIAAINLGGSTDFPQDLGFGTISCTPAPCADQSTFELNYAAHVQDLPGEPSGFNGVPYTLFLDGTVRFLDSRLKTSNGDLGTADRLNVDQVPSDSEVAQQCVGDCFDFTISNITASSVSVVVPLAGGVPHNPVWRLLDANGEWVSFDTSQGDSIESAPFPPGDTQCPEPGSPTYGPLTTGDYCLQLTIKDNGPNDMSPASGTISDPSGMGGGGTAGGGGTFVDTRTTNSGGCTVGSSSKPSQRVEWWLLAGFVAWLGRCRRWRTRS